MEIGEVSAGIIYKAPNSSPEALCGAQSNEHSADNAVVSGSNPMGVLQQNRCM